MTTATTGDTPPTSRSRLLPQGVGVIADVAAVAALLAGGGRPIVWAGSLGAVLAGSYLLVRRLGQPVDRTAVVGLAVAVVGAGIFGYALRPSPPAGPAQQTTTAPRSADPTTSVTGSPTPGAPTGSPAPGASEADTPAQTWLADLAAVDGGFGWRHGTATVNGKEHPRSVIGSTCSSANDDHESFNLGKRYSRFRATVGLAEDAPDDAHTRFRVLVDRKVLFQRDLRLGQTATVEIGVRNGLRLTLEVTNMETSSCGDTAVWGEAVLR
ncbi:NPCBM/NEW2 domain-containing protein [Micromonospora coxensis]|uniref:NPCBM/NEW2 domain-containing protein n=1 Tax=Micromonospora coxensis TaxID=356852 RepID=A0A1C5GP72_9ACTN|nr:NPCBM/NEW2 domain-containing protein [Micromonospora coxensis]SCG35594.1 NPCBM/NEW2 domain-containing protein [Micromonospora coxensis]